MLKFPPDTRIYLAATPIDMRRSFDGLCAIVAETLKLNPLDGHLFLFRGKNADRVKAMYWDRNGLAIWYKRLDSSCCVTAIRSKMRRRSLTPSKGARGRTS